MLCLDRSGGRNVLDLAVIGLFFSFESAYDETKTWGASEAHCGTAACGKNCEQESISVQNDA